MTKTKTISKDESFTAFEKLLTTQQQSLALMRDAVGDAVAMQVAKVRALNDLRAAFDEAAMPAVMQIAGTAIGFRTDRDINGGGTSYPATAVRECVLEALMEGLELMGNQFNIIASRCYITTEGYQHKLAELPHVAELDFEVGNPEDVEIQEENKISQKGEKYPVFTVYGFVPVVARCTIDGRLYTQRNVKTDEIDSRFQVSASGKDRLKTVDSLKAKAEKRARERLFDYASTVNPEAWVPTDVVTPVAITDRSAETVEDDPKIEDGSPRSKKPADRTPDEWKSLFEESDVMEQAGLLRDAPDDAARKKVLAVASKQADDGDIQRNAYVLLVEYAGTKA